MKSKVEITGHARVWTPEGVAIDVSGQRLEILRHIAAGKSMTVEEMAQVAQIPTAGGASSIVWTLCQAELVAVSGARLSAKGRAVQVWGLTAKGYELLRKLNIVQALNAEQ